MTIQEPLPGLLLLRRDVFLDHRGSFSELWRNDRYSELGAAFVQDNVSVSRAGVLRGLHYQLGKPQGKLVSVLAGRIYDVAADIRTGSATFGRWYGVELSAENGLQLFLPPGFAHGFLALEDAVVQYKCTEYFHPGGDAAVRWDDPSLAIRWPAADPILSAKDAAAPRLAELPADRLPTASPILPVG